MNSKFNENDFAVVRDIVSRAAAQNELRGRANYSPGKWLSITGEEFGEICQSLQTEEAWSKETDKSNTYEEIIDLAAACLRWAEQIKRNKPWNH